MTLPRQQHPLFRHHGNAISHSVIKVAESAAPLPRQPDNMVQIKPLSHKGPALCDGTFFSWGAVTLSCRGRLTGNENSALVLFSVGGFCFGSTGLRWSSGTRSAVRSCGVWAGGRRCPGLRASGGQVRPSANQDPSSGDAEPSLSHSPVVPGQPGLLGRPADAGPPLLRGRVLLQTDVENRFLLDQRMKPNRRRSSETFSTFEIQLHFLFGNRKCHFCEVSCPPLQSLHHQHFISEVLGRQ